MYRDQYPGEKPGENDPLMQIDIRKVAEKLKCKPHLLFGFLYYHLEHKYGYPTGENTRVSLFAMKFGDKMHGVNYPYLAAILSGHNESRKKYIWTLGISVFALILSVASIIAQVITSK